MPIVTTFIKVVTYLEGLLTIKSEETYFFEDDFLGISTAIAKIAMLLKNNRLIHVIVFLFQVSAMASPQRPVNLFSFRYCFDDIG